MNQSRFESLGIFLPDKVMSSEEVESKMKNPVKIDIESATGIKERRVRSANEDSFTYAVRAANDCLSHSKYKAEDIDVVISTSISRIKGYPKYYDEPPMSYYIKNAIGAKNAMHFDISNACAGMITAGTVLNNMIRSGKVRNGLVVSGEYITIIAETAMREIESTADLQLASLTVGDAGAAYILDRSETEEGIEMAEMVTIARYADLCFGMPSDKGTGFAMYTRSKDMHTESLSRWPYCIDSMFRKNGRQFNPGDYDHIITHQVSSRSIESFISGGKKHFGSDMPRAYDTVVNYGNTASTTHFVLLYNKIREGEIKPGSKAIFVSNASGIIIGCLSVNFGDVKV